MKQINKGYATEVEEHYNLVKTNFQKQFFKTPAVAPLYGNACKNQVKIELHNKHDI